MRLRYSVTSMETGRWRYQYPRGNIGNGYANIFKIPKERIQAFLKWKCCQVLPVPEHCLFRISERDRKEQWTPGTDNSGGSSLLWDGCTKIRCSLSNAFSIRLKRSDWSWCVCKIRVSRSDIIFASTVSIIIIKTLWKAIISLSRTTYPDSKLHCAQTLGDHAGIFCYCQAVRYIYRGWLYSCRQSGQNALRST